MECTVVVMYHNPDTKQYFFSKQLCQPGVPEGFCLTRFDLPFEVTLLSTGKPVKVGNKEELMTVLYPGMTEIPNPVSEYQG